MSMQNTHTQSNVIRLGLWIQVSHSFNQEINHSYLLCPGIWQTVHQVQKERRKLPRDIEQERDRKHSTQCKETVTHPLRRMMSNDMRNFMS